MPVYEYGLSFEKGHLLVEIEGGKFVLDTGSPMSMSSSPDLNFRGKGLRLPGNVMSLTALYSPVSSAWKSTDASAGTKTSSRLRPVFHYELIQGD